MALSAPGKVGAPPRERGPSLGLGASPVFLVALSMICVAGMLLFLIAWDVMQRRDSALKETALRLESSARINGDHAGRFLQEAESTLDEVAANIADSIFNDRYSPVYLRLMLERQLSFMPHVSNLSVYDRDGRLLAQGGREGRGASHQSINGSTVFLLHRDGWVPSHVVRAAELEEMVGETGSFGLSVALNDGMGGFSGVALAILQPSTFERFFSDGTGLSAVSVIFNDGQILTGWDYERGSLTTGDAITSQPAFADLDASLFEGSGLRMVQTAHRMAVIYQLPRYPAQVVVVQTMTQALAEWRQTLPRSVLLAAMVVGLAFIAGWYLYAVHRRRCRLELALALRERAMLSSPEGIFIVDAQAVGCPMVFVNPALERLSGLSEAALLGRPPEALFGTHEPLLIEDIVKASGESREISMDIAGRSSDGTSFWASLMIAPVRDVQSGAMHYVGFVRDISEAHTAAVQLSERTRDLERSNEELEQFAYVASHDLQEPLRMVSSFLQLLDRRYGDVLDEQGREYISFAVDGAGRMHGLINGLLDYSRVGRLGQEFRAIDLTVVVGQAIKNLSVAIEDAGGTVTMTGVLPTVMGDDRELMRLFQNVIGNAIKYCAADRPPVVTVGCADLGEFWEVAVADNGIGIEPAYFRRIFMIFQRLHGREEYSGTGIGLAVVKKIVERHGGRVEVSSTVGEGAVFRILLPKT